MEQQETFYIEKPLAQAIADYLQTKPWNEVNHLLVALTKLEPVTPVKELKKDK